MQAQAIAWLTDMVPALAEPVFGTLADRKVDLPALVQDDDALAEHIRQNVAGMFHVAGTCRMGAADDRDAVVDNAGRVRGFEGLRVVDASIMPTVPRANTNIPTIMLAEKISAAIVDGRRADPEADSSAIMLVCGGKRSNSGSSCALFIQPMRSAIWICACGGTHWDRHRSRSGYR